MEKSFHGFIERNKKKNSTKSEEEEKRDEEEKKERTQEITRDDLIKQLRKLKRRKVSGKNGIENEAWRYMSTEIGEALWKLVNNIWKKGGGLEQRNNQSNI